MTGEYTAEEVLDVLQRRGELWYFYLDGGVMIHLDGKPLRGCSCPMKVFEDFRLRGVIIPVRKNETGYPFYANNAKSQVYMAERTLTSHGNGLSVTG
jgi:hypothetical protein